jgi:CubicO group peptidase (beta-lactamase class C family)
MLKATVLHRMRMSSPAIGAFTLLGLFTLGSASLAQSHRIPEREMSVLLQVNHVPSASITMVRHRKIEWSEAYGFEAPGKPATDRTLYNIASMAKPISAEVALRLASERKLSLDEPMYRDWTDPDIAKDPRRKLLTPRIALLHRTGFPNWRYQTGNVLTFTFTPGSAFSYSGEGYEYLARFMEKRTGSSFEDLAQRFVLGPVGMQDTAYTRKPWFQERVAFPANPSGEFLPPVFAASAVASDLVYAASRDYAKFLIAVSRASRITPELANERVDLNPGRTYKCVPAPNYTCPSTGVGLGWEVISFGPEKILMHLGKDQGTFSFSYIDLKSGDGLVLLTNGDAGSRLLTRVLELTTADPKWVKFVSDQT